VERDFVSDPEFDERGTLVELNTLSRSQLGSDSDDSRSLKLVLVFSQCDVLRAANFARRSHKSKLHEVVVPSYAFPKTPNENTGFGLSNNTGKTVFHFSLVDYRGVRFYHRRWEFLRVLGQNPTPSASQFFSFCLFSFSLKHSQYSRGGFAAWFHSGDGASAWVI